MEGVERCAHCGRIEPRDGDWYLDLCPRCADETDDSDTDEPHLHGSS
jgi:phage FluMu protein Com